MQGIYNYIPETKMFLRHINLELLCIYKHINLFIKWSIFCTVIFSPSEMCALHNTTDYVVAWYHALPVRFSGTVWVITIYFQLPCYFRNQFFFLSLHAINSYYKLFTFKNHLGYFLNHICLKKLQYLLTHIFLFYYHGLWCPIYC